MKVLKEKNGEENDNLCHEWNWKHLLKEGLNGVVEKINNEKNKLVVVLSKTTQKLEVKLCHNQMLEYLGITKKCKTPLQKNTEN